MICGKASFEALVGVNLLREGLDLPEVSLVAILDADKEGFLRSETSLIQTIGRSATKRECQGHPVCGQGYRSSMQNAIEETERRRARQQAYNEQHGITPATIKKSIRAGIESEISAHRQAISAVTDDADQGLLNEEYLQELEAEMLSAAENLEFERAAAIRDRISELRDGTPKAKSKRGRTNNKRTRRSSKVPRPKQR